MENSFTYYDDEMLQSLAFNKAYIIWNLWRGIRSDYVQYMKNFRESIIEILGDKIYLLAEIISEFDTYISKYLNNSQSKYKLIECTPLSEEERTQFKNFFF